MTTVQGDIRPYVGAVVGTAYQVRLSPVGTNGRPVTVHTPDGRTIAPGAFPPVTPNATTGIWTANLEPCDAAAVPAGFRWRRLIARVRDEVVLSDEILNVPTSVGTVPEGGILDETPAAIETAALGIHRLDTTAHGNPLGVIAAHEASTTAHGNPLAAVTSLSSRATFESLGAVVDQTAARTLEARFLQYIRDAGAASPPVGRNYLGGDITDCWITPAPGSDAMWLFADGFDSGAGAVDPATDLFTASALPIRNGAILEVTPGTFSGAIQLYEAGQSGVWLNAVTQGLLPAGTIWWPIAALDDGGNMRIACWHVESPAATGEPHGRLIDSHIITINAFLGYTSHVATGLGSVTDNFWVCGLLRDTTHTYVLGMEFVPPFDARTTASPSTPNYVFTDPQNHYSRTRIARVANGSLLTVGSWTYWNGSSWVGGAVNAAPMLDVNGAEIRGDAGIRKITNGHYVLAAHRLTDTHLDVYKASTPQGPWTQISRVPTLTQGHAINNGRQVGQLIKILPREVQAPPAEHSIAVVSRNLIDPAVGYSVPAPWTEINIRRFAPQFVVIPHN